MSEENYKDNSEQLEADNQKLMLLMSIEKEKEKQEKMLAIESDVKNVERDMQDIQDLFRDLSKLVNVRIILQTCHYKLHSGTLGSTSYPQFVVTCLLLINTLFLKHLNYRNKKKTLKKLKLMSRQLKKM